MKRDPRNAPIYSAIEAEPPDGAWTKVSFKRTCGLDAFRCLALSRFNVDRRTHRPGLMLRTHRDGLDLYLRLERELASNTRIAFDYNGSASAGASPPAALPVSAVVQPAAPSGFGGAPGGAES